ncbi:MAG TPA: hypothetical protein PLV13_12050, partial [Ilumatobacteraceae bacterium]|nr:hypothetical protein [Ilumatobacteraceae bacterium]
SATRIAGGVLVAASTDRSSYQADGSQAPAGTVIAAIDDDGSVRWVRCLDRTAQVSGAQGSVGYVTLEWETYQEAATLHTIDLADGTLGDEVTELPGQLTPLPYPTWVQPGETLAYYSAAGKLLWSDDNFVHLGGESWNARDVGSIVLAVGCPADQVDYNTDSGCRTPMMRGYRSRDGRVLWERPGMFWLSLGLGGFAIVSDTDGEDRMIDTKTGDDIPGQTWSYEVGFPQGCCADWSTWSHISGGIVITSFDNTLRVYYPQSAGVTPHTVVLP